MTELLTTFASKGGPGAIFAGLLLAAKFLWDAKRQRGNDKTATASSSTSDLATANSLLLKNLEVEREGNAYLRKENADLRDELSETQDKLLENQRNYEAELATLRREAAQFTRRIDELTARLAPPPTT